jgi:transcription elongation factor Elf1
MVEIKKIYERKFRCPQCGSDKVYDESHYDTILRCHGCNFIGLQNEFIDEGYK